ncbi:MAG: ATP-binding cassette domain-containing protein [Ruminococcus sp.]|nr:ATP-binding cassette domain-containing protein [Ruminococcus sp.]HRR78027.1 ATP-binding cassette domain-containing protein [Ruminococcus sp.]
MENIVSFEKVSKKLGGAKVIDKASFGIRKNSICGFIGPNGAGKTTIIKLIFGIINPDSGKITINMKEKGTHSSMGAIVGSAAFYGHLDAYKNMKVVSEMKKGSYDNDEINSLLKLVHLDNTGKKKARDFSLGMKQRLAIAMSLIGDPEFLIWDEPLNGLDPEGIIEVRDIINEIRRKKNATFLISSHILSELDKIADQVVLINHGRILYNNDLSRFLEEYHADSMEESYMRCIREAGAAYEN